ncbi:MAG: hypothetical protein ACJAYE_003613 [Candidatus Azotimanducaceae bacterium]|jgi:hypothetical protein
MKLIIVRLLLFTTTLEQIYSAVDLAPDETFTNEVRP